MSEKFNFKKGDVVCAKDEFIAPHEILKDTAGIVVSYNPENDYLVLGEIHPEKHAIPHTYSMRGEFYRPITDREMKEFGLEEDISMAMPAWKVLDITWIDPSGEIIDDLPDEYIIPAGEIALGADKEDIAEWLNQHLAGYNSETSGLPGVVVADELLARPIEEEIVDEGIVKDFINAFKVGYNQEKARLAAADGQTKTSDQSGSIISKDTLSCDGVKYMVVRQDDPKEVKFIVSPVDPQYLIGAVAVINRPGQAVVFDVCKTKTGERIGQYRCKNWYARNPISKGDAVSVFPDVEEICKHLNLYNKAGEVKQAEVASVARTVVSQLLTGVSPREAINRVLM